MSLYIKIINKNGKLKHIDAANSTRNTKININNVIKFFGISLIKLTAVVSTFFKNSCMTLTAVVQTYQL